MSGQQAEMAIELRDVLGLTHHDTMQAVHVLKNGSPELLKAARAVIRGEVVPILDIPSAQPEVKRARGKEEADDRGKKPRTGVLLSASSFLQAAALESDTGTSLLVPRGRPDAVLRPLLPLLDLRQRYMTRACSRTVHELVDLEARRQCRDFIFDAGLFMWDTGRGRLKPQTLTLRLASFVASHRDAIYHLDLGAAPTQMLQDERVQPLVRSWKQLAG
ncbi:unnamed protein product [Effrenium voratum]|uniref:Uncharacterized protein n=1 Tax=Effrenium voratum TaxID=2562239 RepID=A0AA36ILZ0_9DINO|nr:unnamed protein product [Effrenium voratum]